MFATTLLIFIAVIVIWLYGIINIVYSIQDMLILTNDQPLEKNSSKINQVIHINNVVDFGLQAVIVCGHLYFNI